MSGTTGELSLTELRRNEFVTAFQNVKAKHDYKVLVMDARSIKILKTMLNTGELAETRIVRFEKLGNYREPAQDKDVIYFLTPSPQSIREVITDFTPGPNNPTGKRYGFAHLYFTSALNGALFEMVKASSAIGHIGTLTELCIEYETFDQKVFLAQLANCPLYRIYSPFKLNNNASEFDLMAKKIVNVCDALNIVPVVRYFNPPEEFVPDCKARPLARMVEDEVRRRSGGPSSSSINRARRLGKPEVELLIVDRSIDSLAPLLHEFTYQAMVYDLIPIENGNAYTHVTETGERRKYVLDYNDEVWAKYRYMHISDAQLKLKEEFDQFIQTNRAIVNARNAAPGDINQLKQAMVDMPEAQKKLRLFTLHIDLMRRCMQEFTQQGLEELAAIEQNLATGTTEDGSRYESANVDLPILLRNISSRPQKSTNALRLLLIYMLANKIDQAEILQLAKHFNLGMPAVGIINNLKYLMSRSRVMDLIEILRRRRETSAASKFSFAKILSLNKQAQDDNDDDDVSYDLSRYVPIAKVLLERCIRGGIDDKLFPYISAPAATATSAAAAMPPSASSLPSSGAGPTAQQRPQSNSSSMWNSLLTSISGSQTPSRESETSPSVMARGSLRSTKPTWQKRTSPGPNSSAHSAVQTTTSIPSVTGPRAAPSRESAGMSERITTPRPPRVIIFVVGGVTFSEIRAAHEISQKYECEVLVGSTHLLTPAEYLDGVSTLDHQSVRLPTGEVADTADSYRLLGYPCPEGVDPLAFFPSNASRDAAESSSSLSSLAQDAKGGAPNTASFSSSGSSPQSRNSGRFGGLFKKHEDKSASPSISSTEPASFKPLTGSLKSQKKQAHLSRNTPNNSGSGGSDATSAVSSSSSPLPPSQYTPSSTASQYSAGYAPVKKYTSAYADSGVSGLSHSMQKASLNTDTRYGDRDTSARQAEAGQAYGRERSSSKPLKNFIKRF